MNVAARSRLNPDAVRFSPEGLVPAVVQDASDGRVLMLAWQDREALEQTLATGDVHFHSRSRGTLWRKGETSGNVLRLRRAELDCDADAILLLVEPVGPSCHTGERSCFDVGASVGDPPVSRPGVTGFGWLDDLWSTIQARAAERPAGSYTARLLDGGVDAVARKVAEEAIEVVMAAKDHAAAARNPVATATGMQMPASTEARSSTALTGELADLLYHTLVLMAERGIPPDAVGRTLRERAQPKADDRG